MSGVFALSLQATNFGIFCRMIRLIILALLTPFLRVLSSQFVQFVALLTSSSDIFVK